MKVSRSRFTGLAAVSLLLATLAACERGKAASMDNAATSATAPSASASASAAANAAPSPLTRWTGTYASEKALMYIPRDGDVPNAKDWDGVKFRGDDAGIGLGDGTMTLTLDRATGRVTGSLEGSAGPAVLYGSFGDGRLAATVARKDATDEGLTGVAVATVSDTVVEGSMRLAESNARVVRVATFTLAKSAP